MCQFWPLYGPNYNLPRRFRQGDQAEATNPNLEPE